VSQVLLPQASDVEFGQIDTALGRARETSRTAGAPARALTATIVAVGSEARLRETVEPIEQLGQSGAIRGILVPIDNPGAFAARVEGNVVVLHGLRPAFVDNAIGALRLSSLPTLLWWRGGPAGTLEGVVKLADRVVLDADPPEESWRCAASRFERTAFSDLRWTRLTRWRALMAQFFDLDEVRAASETFRTLGITGSDPASARLFGAWMRTSLEGGERLAVDVTEAAGPPIQRIALGDGTCELTLQLGGTGSCVQASACLQNHQVESRVVTLGDQTFPTLLSEELSIRSRDAAFEAALQAAVEAQ
jgi:glucose-6-phosphate dehydrogenase assembly protein OpcA